MFDLNLTTGGSGEGEISPGACKTRASSSTGPGLVTRELFPARPDGPVQVRKSRRGPRSRSSQYIGITFYRRTGRWESHIWDRGKQVYLGGFDTALAAARAYDRAAIKFRGVEADINFNLSDYDDMQQMMNLSKEEFVQLLRRQSNGFWRGGCKYRGGGLPGGNKTYKGSNFESSNFESSTHNRAQNEDCVVRHSSHLCKGGSHDLDLNLGTPGDRNSTASKAKGDSSGNTERLEGLPVTSEHRNLYWTDDRPKYDEEKAANVTSPQVLAKWAWRTSQSSTPDKTSSSSSSPGATSSMANSNSSLLLPLFYSTHPASASTNDTSQYFSWPMPPS